MAATCVSFPFYKEEKNNSTRNRDEEDKDPPTVCVCSRRWKLVKGIGARGVGSTRFLYI